MYGRLNVLLEDPMTRNLGHVCKDKTFVFFFLLTFVIMDSSSDDAESETLVWTCFRIPSMVFLLCFFRHIVFMSIRQACSHPPQSPTTIRHSCQGYIVDILRQHTRNHLIDPSHCPNSNTQVFYIRLY